MGQMENVVDIVAIENFAPLPLPPPLPCLPTVASQKKVLAMAMAIIEDRSLSSVQGQSSVNLAMAMAIIKDRLSSVQGQSSVNPATKDLWVRLFDQAYRADVVIHADSGDKIFAHGMASPVIKHMLRQSKRRDGRQSIAIHGVPHDAVRIFIRFLYSSCYDLEEMKEYVLHLLVLSHVFVVPHLKRECEAQLENDLLNLENVIDVFQLALLCDAPRLALICHHMILDNFRDVSSTEGWRVMKEAHPGLEREILETMIDANTRQKELVKKSKERKMYIQLYDAMEALVHICRDGCKTIGPHDKAPKGDKAPCGFAACKGLELLLRHFAACKLRVRGGCAYCKRVWQLLELHSYLCANSELCRVPLCRSFKERSAKHRRKEEMRWEILAKKILRTKSISGAPFFSLVASSS